MKRIMILGLLLLCLTGCTNINEKEPIELINEIKSSKFKGTNKYRNGYKYYLPQNMNILNSEKSNEILEKEKTKYYLYVDMVSYYNKINIDYVPNDNSYLSVNLKDQNKFGYLEINVKDDKYLIELMYNYAKIEVIVDKDNINSAITDSFIILSSIEYNDSIIKNMLEENILNYSEEEISIFDTDASETNFLDIIQKYDNYEDNGIPDYDLIN